MAAPPMALAMSMQLHPQHSTPQHMHMDSLEWSRYMAVVFLSQHDREGTLQGFRHYIPRFVLQEFCTPDRLKAHHLQSGGWYSGDEAGANEADTLVIYDPKTKRFDKRHWSDCFGESNIYEHYFDNLKYSTYSREGFRTFEALKRIDTEIFEGLTDPMWQIYQSAPRGEIVMRRGDLFDLRKLLFLQTSIRNRDRNQHLMAHDESMVDAKQRRKKFMQAHMLDHPRDLWLQNVELILNNLHYDIASDKDIFELDREDYRVNARERFVVFWEAGPGEEFVLTDNSFGCFEGGQLGGRKKSNVKMTAREHEERIYTRDYMWHQLYVLSPKLVLALCHGTLLHPDLTKAQRKRWGLRRSLLENLPHPIANNYYKDLAKGEVSFLKQGWEVPQEVEKVFGQQRWDGKVIAIENREHDELVFPISRLSPNQVNSVNCVLLQNQTTTQPVQSVSFRPPSSYRSLHDSLVQFRETEWPKYTDLKQNSYSALEKRLNTYLSRTDEVLSNGTTPTLRPSPTVLSPQSQSPAPENRKPVVDRKKTNGAPPPPASTQGSESVVTRVEIVSQAGERKKERKYSVSHSNNTDAAHRRERSNPPSTQTQPAPSQLLPLPDTRRAPSNERSAARRAPSKERSSVEPPQRRATVSQAPAPAPAQQQQSQPSQQQPQPQSQQQQRRAPSNDRRYSVASVEQARAEVPVVKQDNRPAPQAEQPAKVEPVQAPQQQKRPPAPYVESCVSTVLPMEPRRSERSVSAGRRQSVYSQHEQAPPVPVLEKMPPPPPVQQQQQQPQHQQQQTSIPDNRRPTADRRYTEMPVRNEHVQQVQEARRPNLADKRYYSTPGTNIQQNTQPASIPVPEPKMSEPRRRVDSQTRQQPAQPSPVHTATSTANSTPAHKPSHSTSQVPALSLDSMPKMEQSQRMTLEQQRINMEQVRYEQQQQAAAQQQQRILEHRAVEQRALEQQVPMDGYSSRTRETEHRALEQRALEQQVSMDGYNRSRDRSQSSHLAEHIRNTSDDRHFDKPFDRQTQISEVSVKSASTGSSNSSGSSGSGSGPPSGPGSESRALERISSRDVSPKKRQPLPVVHISNKPQRQTQNYPTATIQTAHTRVQSLKYNNSQFESHNIDVAESMIVEVDDDQESWEDEGYAEVSLDVAKPRKPIVRFASPKPSPTMRKASIMGLNHRARYAGHVAHAQGTHHIQAHAHHTQQTIHTRRGEY